MLSIQLPTCMWRPDLITFQHALRGSSASVCMYSSVRVAYATHEYASPDSWHADSEPPQPQMFLTGIWQTWSKQNHSHAALLGRRLRSSASSQRTHTPSRKSSSWRATFWTVSSLSAPPPPPSSSCDASAVLQRAMYLMTGAVLSPHADGTPC